MDSIWSDIIKATGSVGVVAFLIYFVLGHVYSDQIVALFGSDKLFALTVIVIAALLIVLLVSILKSKEKTESSHPSDGPKITYSDNSIHNGDNNF